MRQLMVLAAIGCSTPAEEVTEPPPPPPAPAPVPNPAPTAPSHLGPTDNRLVNGGFEQGASWSRPRGGVSRAWQATGAAIYQSPATFTAAEGTWALKIWGLYAGDVPNDSEHGLTLTDLAPGDAHVVTARVFTHPDDRISGGNAAGLFLRFVDAAGRTLRESVSAPFDETSEAGTWQTLRVEGTAPEGTVAGALGLRFTLADWSATGSVYLDDVAWTSTGPGRIEGERLLVWHDEFDGATVDQSRWTRLEIPAFRYNNELQAYTASPDNADVRDGQLVITARSEPDGTITSGRLVTDGKAEWTYGRVEALAQVPAGVGTWPAFWMLPSDWTYGGWPHSGEIDIMEHVGCDLDVVHATVHTGAYNHLLGTQRGGSLPRDASQAMHLYAAEWTADRIVFTVDGDEITRFSNDGARNPATWPFDQRFHVILNLAFGGDWGGFCGVDEGALPQEFRIDWVRVYQ